MSVWLAVNIDGMPVAAAQTPDGARSAAERRLCDLARGDGADPAGYLAELAPLLTITGEPGTIASLCAWLGTEVTS